MPNRDKPQISDINFLGYSGPLLFKDSTEAFLVSHNLGNKKHVRIKDLFGVLGIQYQMNNNAVSPLPEIASNDRGLKLRFNQLIHLPSKTQVAVDNGLFLYQIEAMYMVISRIENVSS